MCREARGLEIGVGRGQQELESENHASVGTNCICWDGRGGSRRCLFYRDVHGVLLYRKWDGTGVRCPGSVAGRRRYSSAVGCRGGMLGGPTISATFGGQVARQT